MGRERRRRSRSNAVVLVVVEELAVGVVAVALCAGVVVGLEAEEVLGMEWDEEEWSGACEMTGETDVEGWVVGAWV